MVKQICKIKDVFDLFAGGDVNREHFSAYKTNTHVFGVYSNSLTNHGLYGYTDAPKYAGDSITITGRGSVGHAEYRQFDFDAVIRLLVLIPKGKDILDSRYVTELINNHVKFPLESTGVPQLTVPQIENIELSLPMVEEQRNIADALSDVDSMIFSLEKLIAKKRAIKQGAMQELLTGKKRLPGFSGEWKKCSFGDVFDFIPNNAFTRAEMSANGTVKNIHYGDVLTKYGCWIDANDTDIPYLMEHINLDRFRATCYLQTGDVIIADTAEDETVGKALEIINVAVPVLAGQHTLLCRSRIKFADKFLGYYLNADCYHSQLLPFIVGTKVSSISKAGVAQTGIYLPSIEEQTAIASILSGMDSEIEALEEKLEKIRQVKQGMMQELLTGRIRLV